MAISIGKVRTGKKLLRFRGVTIHNTDNSDAGAGAQQHFKYLQNKFDKPKVYGFHYAVDGNEAVLCIPLGEIGEHTGKREGNDTTVGIEICMNADGDLLVATDRAARLTAEILKDRGFSKAVWKENIFQHNDWSGKNCPSQLRAGKPYDFETFVAKVNEYMGAGATQPEQPAPPTTPEQPKTDLPEGTYYFRLKTNQRAYFRSEPDTSNDGNIITTLDKGAQVRYKGDFGEFYKVRWDGRDGFVANRLMDADYLPESEEIGQIQDAVGTKHDLIYGKNTADAVGAKQAEAGIVNDCIFGSDTRAALGR